MKVVRNFIPDFDAHGHLYLLTTCDKGTTLRNTLGYNYNDNIIKNQNHFQVLLPALPSRFDSCNCYWGGLKKLGCPSWWWVGFPFISMIKRRERKGRESQREREGGREGWREGWREGGRKRQEGRELQGGRKGGWERCHTMGQLIASQIQWTSNNFGVPGNCLLLFEISKKNLLSDFLIMATCPAGTWKVHLVQYSLCADEKLLHLTTMSTLSSVRVKI